MKRPLILVPTSEQNITGEPKRLYFNRAYAKSIENAGGIVFGVARPSGEDVLDELIDRADGLYITGGGDMNTHCYGEESRADAHNDAFDDERDALELALIKRAIAKRMPILGICRGMQDLNVYFGGTLYQDIALNLATSLHDNRTTTERGQVRHRVLVESGTVYQNIVGEKEIGVNSLHHQGVKTLGAGLVVGGKAEDGLIEAIELADYPFCIGVQWHPEELHDTPSQKLFTAFIAATKNRT